MPKCNNCGSHVTTDYNRVFGDRNDSVEVCPNCPDRVIDPQSEGGYRESPAKKAILNKSVAADGGNK